MSYKNFIFTFKSFIISYEKENNLTRISIKYFKTKLRC